MRRSARTPASICLLLALGCSSEALAPEPGGDGAASSSGGSSGGGSAAPLGPKDFELVDYPPGPYGTKQRSVIDNFAFLGWRQPSAVGYDLAALETVRLSDFYNPGGVRSDVKLLVINASAVWCTVCRAEYRHIKESAIYQTYRQRGVEIIGTLFEDVNSGPSKPSDLKAWGEAEAHQVEFSLVLDPANKLGVFFSSDATPLNLLVDARTMTVLDVAMGYSTDYWRMIDSLLERL